MSTVVGIGKNIRDKNGFIDSSTLLEMVRRHWYTLVELQRGTVEWERFDVSFIQSFEFTSEHPTIDVVLQMIKENLFE